MLPESLTRLVQLLSRLPGVGEKTAQRFALHLISTGDDLAARLGAELSQLAARVQPCARCGNIAELTDDGPATCAVCRDTRREPELLCVVARVQDLLAVERSGAMRGRYFVLGKLLSPLDGVGPSELPLAELKRRIIEDGVKEVLVATPPSVDGEATALLLSRELGDQVRLTRIASGVPHGGDLEFADRITLGRAIDGRRNLD
ncbi:MAG: recombination mediator RecR [Polyangiaceae bacterium]|nr:recombination mediator RecR [Polyangiaceae bacterium]MCW5791934.1 recombination mediator RecR [Polyangiaceae bacterium]